MRRILVLYAHPDYGDSRANSILASHVRSLPGVTFRNLYEECEGFFIDEHHEQRLLLEHDLIVFQHPFHWYSCPALLKEWQDVTLRKGWAYGDGGTRLTGKSMLSVVTTGGSEAAYSPQGHNRFTVQEFLRPFE
jgi:glutathione-regulated potassium-efflux system ancillary protein KefG